MTNWTFTASTSCVTCRWLRWAARSGIPGQYLLSERMRVSDLIYLAGGLKEDAYQAARRAGQSIGG